MTENKECGLMSPADILTTVDASVDMAAVADVLVVAEETQLEKQEAVLHEKSTTIAKALKKSEENLKKAINSQAFQFLGYAPVKAAIKAMARVGIKLSPCVSSADVVSADRLEIVLNLENKSSSYSREMATKPVKVKLSHATRNASEEVKKLTEQKQVIEKELYNIIKRLKSIDKLQRRAKATVAITNLQRTEEGRKFLNRLSENRKSFPAALT